MLNEVKENLIANKPRVLLERLSSDYFTPPSTKRVKFTDHDNSDSLTAQKSNQLSNEISKTDLSIIEPINLISSTPNTSFTRNSSDLSKTFNNRPIVKPMTIENTPAFDDSNVNNKFLTKKKTTISDANNSYTHQSDNYDPKAYSQINDPFLITTENIAAIPIIFSNTDINVNLTGNFLQIKIIMKQKKIDVLQ